MPKIVLNGYQLYFESQGNGETVVYIHGGFPSLSMAMRELQPYDWSWEWEFAGGRGLYYQRFMFAVHNSKIACRM